MFSLGLRKNREGPCAVYGVVRYAVVVVVVFRWSSSSELLLRKKRHCPPTSPLEYINPIGQCFFCLMQLGVAGERRLAFVIPLKSLCPSALRTFYLPHSPPPPRVRYIPKTPYARAKVVEKEEIYKSLECPLAPNQANNTPPPRPYL